MYLNVLLVNILKQKQCVNMNELNRQNNASQTQGNFQSYRNGICKWILLCARDEPISIIFLLTILIKRRKRSTFYPMWRQKATSGHLIEWKTQWFEFKDF